MMTQKPSDLKIVFLGTPDFATHILSRIVDAGYQVMAVVTMPDKPAGRGHKLQPSSVKVYASEQGIPVLQPEKLRDEAFLATLRGLEADLFVVVAFRMLPREVWSMPPRGTFNLHASLLPKYRGAAPIQHAILDGEKTTGVTTFFLDEEIDMGQVLCRREVDITPDETGGTLHDKLMHVGGDLVVETLEMIQSQESVTTTPQSMMCEDETSLRLAPKIFKADRMLAFGKSTAVEVDRRIRAMSPYPAAIMTWQMVDGSEMEVKVFGAELRLDETSVPAGALKATKEGLLVGTSHGALLLNLIQLPSKRPMSSKDLLNGLDLSSVQGVI